MSLPTFTVLDHLSKHLAKVDLLMYAGSDAGAHQPVYFVKPSNIAVHVARSVRFMKVMRTTASLYSAPHRTLESAELVWTVIADFDYDRGDMAGLPRGDQEVILINQLNRLLPTFAVETRAGFHLYWVLETPEPIFSYAYTASILRDALQADPSTVVPTHCMSLYSFRKDKPGRIVDTLTFPNAQMSIPLEGFQTYTLADIQHAFQDSVQNLISDKFIDAVVSYTSGALVKKSDDKKFQLTEERRQLIDDIISDIDLIGFLKSRGYQAYGRGVGKIVMCCPYHLDRHPSAFINIDPYSSYYGMFHCVSCGKKRSLPNMLEDISKGVV